MKFQKTMSLKLFGKVWEFVMKKSFSMVLKKTGGAHQELRRKCWRMTLAVQTRRFFIDLTRLSIIQNTGKFVTRTVNAEGFWKLQIPFLFNIERKKMDLWRN